MDATVTQRYIRAFGTNDCSLLDEIQANGVAIYSPIAWGWRGK